MTAALVPSPVRIIGTGLIGGSLGLALRALDIDVQVEDVSPGTTALAVEMGVGVRAEQSSPQPRLVLVAAPPDVVAALVADALQRFPEAVVADVASVKAGILQELRTLVDPDQLARYCGAHPMAGREISGVIAARGHLFRGRPFVVVPHETTAAEAVSALRALATEIGSVTSTMDAQAHDLAVARVSHVPQMVASALAATLTAAQESALSLAGQGLRDTTRIADSDPRLWTEILAGNAPAVAEVLAEVRERLERAGGALQDLGSGVGRRGLADLIVEGNAGVRRIPGKHGGSGDDFATLTVLVPDQPGELARLLTEIGEEGINLEDLRLEHTMGRRVGLAHLAVARSAEDLLTRALGARGWTVVPG